MKEFAIFAALLLFLGITVAEKVGEFEMGNKVKLPTTKAVVVDFKKAPQAAQLAAPAANALMPNAPIKVEIENFAGGLADSIYAAGSGFCKFIAGR